MGISESIRNDLAEIMKAPHVFFGILGLWIIGATAALIGIFAVIYSAQIEGLKQQATTLEARLDGKDDDIERLNGQVAELRLEIEAVEQERQRYLEVLDDYVRMKQAELDAVLQAKPAATVEIFGAGVLAEEVREIFTRNGWQVLSVETAPVWAQAIERSTSAVILNLPANDTGETVKAAFDAANIPYQLGDGDVSMPEIWISAITASGGPQGGLQPLPMPPEQGRLEPSPSGDSPSVFVPALPSDVAV
jgi:uncharacterized coiled-coil protein SlyX